MKLTGNTILITGGGSGIGLALAREFHGRGNQVIITGRRMEVLEAAIARYPGMAAYVTDVRDFTALKTLAETVLAAHPDLNVLINNAGVMPLEDLTAGESALAALESTLGANLLGPIRLTALLTPHFLRQGSATVVNVGSGLAHVPLAAVPIYSASKAAIHSYTQSLRHQLADTSIEILEIIPPAVHTGLLGSDTPAPHEMPLSDFIEELMRLFERDSAQTELCVANVLPLRLAEASGAYDDVFRQVNGEIAL